MSSSKPKLESSPTSGSNPSTPNHFHFQINASQAGQRLDTFLADQDSFELTRSLASKLIKQQHVLLNGNKTKASSKLKDGDRIAVSLPPAEPASLQAEAIPLDILFEDSDIIVVNKPAGMVVHPGAGQMHGTLTNALLAHCKDLSNLGGPARPGIVHRLDKETSGVMVAAKNNQAHAKLSEMFAAREVEKTYWALVYGDIEGDQGALHGLISRHPKDRKKMTTETDDGREAITKWQVLERFGLFTAIHAFPKTGRTHQIRVQFADAGHPLVGDKLYKRQSWKGMKLSNEVRTVLAKLDRHALHAQRLAFKHPQTGKNQLFSAPLSQELVDLNKELS